ncbi:MAG TPA: hypothetical protein DCS67_02025 [Clostridiales bacterium UBA8960]|nr:hypothetical protein [Clostridiales bacterium UBA8960]
MRPVAAPMQIFGWVTRVREPERATSTEHRASPRLAHTIGGIDGYSPFIPPSLCAFAVELYLSADVARSGSRISLHIHTMCRIGAATGRLCLCFMNCLWGWFFKVRGINDQGVRPPGFLSFALRAQAH